MQAVRAPHGAFRVRGTRIEPAMLTIKRPGGGIRPKFADLVVGRVASVDIPEDTVITWEML